LGDAREQAGMEYEALVSYRRFLELAGDYASPAAHEIVRQLESKLAESLGDKSPS
jgi:hypothetical protein